MINVLETQDCEMVLCGVKYLSEDSNDINYFSNKKPLIIMDNFEALKKFLYRDISAGIWSLMIKREIIENNALRFADGYRYSEDIEYIYKMMCKCKKIGFLRQQLYLYRVRNTSVMSQVDDKRLDGFKLMKGLEIYFDLECPYFAQKFKKFGVARWVWATLWQSALASKCFSDFVNSYKIYNANQYLKRLILFPKINVSITSLMFVVSPRLYYMFIRLIGRRRLNGRTLKN
jgi:hypothetical protein